MLPKKCTTADYLSARQGKSEGIEHLEDCVLNFEIHTSGYHEQWAGLYPGQKDCPPDREGCILDNNDVNDITQAISGLAANQYGRTNFLIVALYEQHIPVDMSIYDKVYNASLYTQYLPMVNPADLTLNSKDYTDDFWHAFFMSNHMNQTPDHFIRGIRGRTL